MPPSRSNAAVAQWVSLTPEDDHAAEADASQERLHPARAKMLTRCSIALDHEQTAAPSGPPTTFRASLAASHRCPRAGRRSATRHVSRSLSPRDVGAALGSPCPRRRAGRAEARAPPSSGPPRPTGSRSQKGGPRPRRRPHCPFMVPQSHPDGTASPSFRSPQHRHGHGLADARRPRQSAAGCACRRRAGRETRRRRRRPQRPDASAGASLITSTITAPKPSRRPQLLRDLLDLPDWRGHGFGPPSQPPPARGPLARRPPRRPEDEEDQRAHPAASPRLP